MRPIVDRAPVAAALDYDSTLIGALEPSSKKWVVAVQVPASRKHTKYTVEPNGPALAALLETIEARSAAAGKPIARVVVTHEAGRDGFWLARFLMRRGVEVHVMQASSLPVDRRARRAKTDAIDAEMLLRTLLAFLRGEPRVCSMVPVPSEADEEARRAHLFPRFHDEDRARRRPHDRGDPNLKSERLFGWEIGGTFRLPTLTSVQLTYYENYLSDLIYQVPIIQGTTNDLNRNVNVGKAYVRGIEAVVRQAVTEELQIYGTLSRQDNRVTQVDRQPQLVSKLLTDVPRIMFALGAEWKWDRWAASVEAKHTGSTFATSDTLNQGTGRGVTGAYDPHTLVNAKISYRIDDAVTFSVAGANLLNLRYYEYYLAPGLTITTGLSMKY